MIIWDDLYVIVFIFYSLTKHSRGLILIKRKKKLTRWKQSTGSMLKRRNEIVVKVHDFDNLGQKEMLIQRSIFWAITVCSVLKVNEHFRGMCRFHFHWFLSCLIPQPWRWKWHVLWNTGWLEWTSQCYIPENGTPHNHHCESLKSYRDTDIS